MVKVENFNVRIVAIGDRYGLNDCLVNDQEPMIEFYDARYGHPGHPGDLGRGQFVSRYFTRTLLQRTREAGLQLDGGVPEWSISAEGMREVFAYMNLASTSYAWIEGQLVRLFHGRPETAYGLTEAPDDFIADAICWNDRHAETDGLQRPALIALFISSFLRDEEVTPDLADLYLEIMGAA